MTAEYNNKIDKSYSDLYNHIVMLNNHYLKKHIENQLSGPDQFDLDVKSFCVLSHAAFEEFLEVTALTVMDYSIKEYINRRNVTISLSTLFHFKIHLDIKLIIDKNDNSPQLLTIFDYMREKINDVREIFSSEIFNNHGVSLKYMKNLLLPIAINIPKEENLINSLNKIVGERGSYAHKFTDGGRVKRSISPEQADEYVFDCLILFDQLANVSKNL